MRGSKNSRALDQAARTVTQIGLSYGDGAEVPVATDLKVTVHGTPGHGRTVTVKTTSGQHVGDLYTDGNGVVLPRT